MGVYISKLTRKKFFENDKIEMSFSTGDVSNDLSVYIKDEKGGRYHILWEISPDRCRQSFDKANDKIRVFVEAKIKEWLKEDEELERLKTDALKKAEQRKENHLKELMDKF